MKAEFLVVIFLMFITVFLLGVVGGQKMVNRRISKLLDEIEKEVK